MSNENNVGKHTPGPYRIDRGPFNPSHLSARRRQPPPRKFQYRIVGPQGEVIGYTDHEPSARLIAAAPQLFAALSECEAYLEQREDVVDGDYGEPVPNREMALLREVRAALAAAGVTP